MLTSLRQFLTSATLATVLATSMAARADSKLELPYVGVVTGTNQLAGQTPEGAPVFVNAAREVSNFGGPCVQENTLVIAPLFGAGSATVVGYRCYGTTVSHKAGGDVYISYVLDQRISDRIPAPFSGTFTITGGTGKFAGATGNGVIQGLDFGNGVFSNAYQGKIVFAAGYR